MKPMTELQKLKDAYDVLCESHNDLCRAHDTLVEEFKVLATLVDEISEVVFDPPSELDS